MAVEQLSKRGPTERPRGRAAEPRLGWPNPEAEGASETSLDRGPTPEVEPGWEVPEAYEEPGRKKRWRLFRRGGEG